MIPQKSGIQVQSTVVGESFAMQIDNSMLTHIMGILTDLYADRILAIIREYSCNAIDSHVAAGTKRPIEVSTPTSLRPIFTVRDYGLGLDEDDIENIYSRYGVSTKRESNDVVGMLGIGCKSALAYTDQFTVIGFKDGLRTTVVVSRDADGTGKMVVLSKEATSEPNGAEIIVPVNGGDEFEWKAKQFFRFWEPGTVLLDGVEPEPIEGFELSESMSVVREERGSGNTWIVMGNVPYPANLSIQLPYDRTLIARVPIGSVQFAPSREALMDTDHTKETLEAVAERFEELASTAAQREADDSATAPEAARRANAVANILNRKLEGTTWQGEVIPAYFEYGETTRPFVADIIDDGGTASKVERLYVAEASRALWVLNYQNQVFSRPMRRKLLAYCDAHQIDVPGKVVTYWDDQLPATKWIGEVETIDWELVRKWRDPNKKRSARRSGGGAYEGIDTEGNSTSLHADEIDESLPIFYADNHERLVDVDNHRVLSEAFDGCYLVRMPSTRIAKFCRTFPDARPAREALEEVALAWWQSLSGSERMALAGLRRPNVSYHFRSAADTLLEMGEYAHQFEDRDLRSLLLVRRCRSGAVRRRWEDLHGFLSAETLAESGPTLKQVAERYPLCPTQLGHGEQASRTKQHVLVYVNAAHAAAAQPAQENGAK